MTEKVDPNPIISPVLPDFHAKYLVEKDLRIYYQDLVYGLCSLFDDGDNVCQIGELKGKVAELLQKESEKRHILSQFSPMITRSEALGPDFEQILEENRWNLYETEDKPEVSPKFTLTSSPLDDSWLYHKFVDVAPEAEIKKLRGELAYWKHAATEIAIQRDNAIHGTACDIVDMIEKEYDINLSECNCQSCIDTRDTQEHLARIVKEKYCPEIEYNLDTDSEPLDRGTLAMIEKF